MTVTTKEFNARHGALIGTMSANYVKVSGAAATGTATPNAISIEAVGSDTNISINLIPKGTGVVTLPATGLNGGTNNGVLYVNSANTWTSGTSLTFDGTNLALFGTGSLKGSYGAGGVTTNFAAGDNALISNTTGSSSSAIGNSALYTNTTGIHNSAMGKSALYANTTGSYNSAMGKNALFANTTSNYNSAMGYLTLASNTTGIHNSAMGANALTSNTTGWYNSAIGDGALQNNTTGSSNTAMGYNSGDAITTGSNNVVIGGYTGGATPISQVGSNFIVLSDGTGTVRQTINSTGAVAFDTAGTSFGTSGQVLQSNSSTGVPTWVTLAAGGVISFAGGTTGLTPAAATTGAISLAGTLVVANGGTGVTTLSGFAFGNATGAFTAATTAQALTLIGTVPIANGGTNSTATATAGGIGYGTGTAHAYTAVGTAGQVLTSAGVGAPTWTIPASGSTITEDPAYASPQFLSMTRSTSGTVTTLYTASNGLYFVPSTGTLNSTIFNSLSDENKKINIKVIPNALSIVENIRGVTFDWKANGLPSAGLIAQDVEKYLPELISTTADAKSLNYNGVIGILVEAIKELSGRIKILENK
jgi:trimeric autotransporter adhesin